MFVIPEDEKTPVIMVGPGTGVVPFIGFIEEREAKGMSGQRGETHLFFGCRRPNTDFIFKHIL